MRKSAALNRDQDLELANGDPVQVETAILNLRSNARDAMREGGMLRIAVTAEVAHQGPPQWGSCLHISIEHTGIGIDDVIGIRAVEPFFSIQGIGNRSGL